MITPDGCPIFQHQQSTTTCQRLSEAQIYEFRARRITAKLKLNLEAENLGCGPPRQPPKTIYSILDDDIVRQTLRLRHSTRHSRPDVPTAASSEQPSQNVHHLTAPVISHSSTPEFPSLAIPTRVPSTMRSLHAIASENELDRPWTYTEDDARPGRLARLRAGATGACCEYDKALPTTARTAMALEGPAGFARQSDHKSNCDDKFITTTRQHSRRKARSAMSRATSLLMVVSLLQPAAAVLIDQWENCISQPSNKSAPQRLQWVPLYVGAEFGGDPTHTLRVTVWGNVTGSYDPSVTLPAWNDPAWDDVNNTDGKIVRNPFPLSAAKLTTLRDKIDVLTYEPYAADFDFCDDALTNASCPLGPVFNTTDMYVSASSPDPSSAGFLDVGGAMADFEVIALSVVLAVGQHPCG